MHIEVLVEDSSGKALVDLLLPKIIGNYMEPHTWRTHSYKGIGQLPAGLGSKPDPAKRVLLDKLPKALSGYANTLGIDAVVVVCDTDGRDCKQFLAELRSAAQAAGPRLVVLFRLAIEEVEAWLLGDRQAVLAAYPRAKVDVLSRYDQDSVCGTWEVLAEAVYPGGIKAIRKNGFWVSGDLKHEWARRIGPLMNIEDNQSPSFCKFRDGLRRICGISA